MNASGVSVWWRSRWCLQERLHLLPVLTQPSRGGGRWGRFPGCLRAAADRLCFGYFYLPPLHGASWGQLLRACKDVRGGGGGQGVGLDGGGGVKSWVGCMPSAGGERPGFTIILPDNHFHNPKAARSSCSGGLW